MLMGLNLSLALVTLFLLFLLVTRVLLMSVTSTNHAHPNRDQEYPQQANLQELTPAIMPDLSLLELSASLQGALPQERPASPATVPLQPQQASSGVGGLLESLLSGGDAESQLVAALVDHHLVMSKEATEAAAFLFTYGLADVLDFILTMRRYQTRPKSMRDALEAVSLKKFMNRIEVNLGSK